ncbi:hypothetical protein [Streptomyces sp. SCSIO ZS0520]|uniref:hypothetical protein n=1 Tax=Streptomyces sp. SCSIO ZS0520 TaxID=2892996 RepID=UPI0021DA0993|nr:hypothetical protein [Streptomyces sp. SCSIO ZS0520]
MLKYPRTRLLAAVTGAGWSHPYTSPFVLYADGGDSDAGAGDDGGDDGAGDDGTGDDDAEDGEGGKDDGDADEDALGDKGKKALRELRRENRQLKARLRQSDAGGKDTKSSAKDGKDGDGDDAEAIREQARAEARAEVWNERVESAAIAAAAGRLANPQLAARLLDLSEVGENDKGRPDRDAIGELIDELLEDEPYLAAQSAKDSSGRRFQGDADSGARKKTKKTASSLDEAVAAKFAGKSGG